jgi:hypothetical protein
LYSYWFRSILLPQFPTQWIDPENSTETWVTMCKTTRYKTQEEHNLNFRRHRNFWPQIHVMFCLMNSTHITVITHGLLFQLLSELYADLKLCDAITFK